MSGPDVFIDGLPAAASVSSADLVVVDQGGTPGFPGTAITRRATVSQVLAALGVSSAMQPVVAAETTQAAVALLNYLSPQTGAVVRALTAKLSDFVSVKDFGATGNGTIDDTAAVQAAIDYVNGVGGTLYFPPGNYKITGVGLTIDRSSQSVDDDLTHISLLGAGKGNTQLTYTGTGTLLTYTGNVSGTAVGLEGYFTIGGIRFQGPGPTSTAGIQITGASFFALRDLVVQSFGSGIIGLDVLDGLLQSVLVNVCTSGLSLSYQAFTPPNAIVIEQCNFLACTNNGVTITDPSTVTWVGGSVEECGVGGTGNTYGVLIASNVGAGGNGGALAAAFTGVYFEGNAGTADIWFNSGANAGGPTGVLVQGCTFNRLSNAAGQFVTNNILLQQGTAFNSALTVIGNGFRKFGSYSPSASRPYIAIQASSFDWTYTAFGNIWGDAVEIPAIAAPTSTPAALATAWCRFNGTVTGTNAPTQGFNVASVTRTAAGTYTIAFAQPFQVAGYCISGSVNGTGIVALVADTLANVQIETLNTSGTATDFSAVSLQVFGSGPS